MLERFAADRLLLPALFACFAAAALPLALAGPRFVPAAAHARPEWLLGPYGNGLGLQRGGDWVRAAGWAALSLLLATSWLMPWYVLWVLPFAAVAGDGPLSVTVLALCAFQLTSRVPL